MVSRNPAINDHDRINFLKQVRNRCASFMRDSKLCSVYEITWRKVWSHIGITSITNGNTFQWLTHLLLQTEQYKVIHIAFLDVSDISNVLKSYEHYVSESFLRGIFSIFVNNNNECRLQKKMKRIPFSSRAQPQGKQKKLDEVITWTNWIQSWGEKSKSHIMTYEKSYKVIT